MRQLNFVLPILAILMFLVFPRPVRAQESGAFLKIPMSVRAGAMGDAYTAIANDPLGIYYNPAGICFAPKPIIAAAHHIYLQDISGDSLGFIYPSEYLSIGGAFSMFRMKEETIYDSSGNDTGEKFGYQAMVSPIALGLSLGHLGIAYSFKPYSEKIGDQSSKTNLYDMGAILRFSSLSFGFSSQNQGGKIFDYAPVKISRFGAAYSGRYITLVADAVKEGKDAQSINAGAEINLADTLKARGGWRLKEDFGGPTFGLGLQLGRFSFDYAFLGYGDLGVTHKAGLSFAFGETAPRKKQAPGNSPIVTASSKTNIAVADFVGKNVSLADASIVTDFLRTGLVGGGVFNVMDRTNMETVLAEQKFQSSGCTEQECAVQMGKLLNVKYMVVGSLSKLLDSYYITVNLIDVQTAKILASYDQEASSARGLREACASLAQKLSVYQ